MKGAFLAMDTLDNKHRGQAMIDKSQVRLLECRHRIRVVANLQEVNRQALHEPTVESVRAKSKRSDDSMTTWGDMIVLGRHHNHLSSLFRRDSWFLDQVGFTPNCALPLYFGNNVSSLLVKKKEIPWGMHVLPFIHDLSVTACMATTGSWMLCWEMVTYSTLIMQQSKRKCWSHESGAKNLADFTPITSKFEEAKILVLPPDKCLNTLSISFHFSDPHFHNFSNHSLGCYQEVYARHKWKEADKERLVLKFVADSYPPECINLYTSTSPSPPADF